MRTARLVPRLIIPVLMAAPTASAQDLQTNQAAPTFDQQKYVALAAKQLHEIGGHHQLSEYIEQRRLAVGGALPDPGEDVAHFALKSIGQRYKRNAYDRDLGKAGTCSRPPLPAATLELFSLHDTNITQPAIGLLFGTRTERSQGLSTMG